MARTMSGKGRVVRIFQKTWDDREGNARTNFYPVICFLAPNGHEWEAVSIQGSNPCPYKVGEVVDIRFDPHNPENLAIDGYFKRVLGQVNWGLMLVGLVVIGILALLFNSRK